MKTVTNLGVAVDLTKPVRVPVRLSDDTGQVAVYTYNPNSETWSSAEITLGRAAAEDGSETFSLEPSKKITQTGVTVVDTELIPVLVFEVTTTESASGVVYLTVVESSTGVVYA